MCGIAGLFDFQAPGRAPGDQHALVQAMTTSLQHRGPDGAGLWVGEGAALGHRRLAIIDLSELASQPFVTASGRYVITYNGEVYNFADLRRDLEADGIRFRSHSDTEVIAEACEHWGVAETARRLNGMFAFAAFHRATRTLTLVRDRLGIKPLYWLKTQNRIAFASEPRALTLLPGFDRTLDRAALAAYFRLGYIPAPRSVWQSVRKLAPASLLTINAEGHERHELYWDLSAVALKGATFRGSEREAVGQLDMLLGDAVKGCMIADVPLGAFLSGGIDSTSVVAQMTRFATAPVRTFSIGFDEPRAGYDEAAAARAVARHLGTEHTELYASPSDAQDLVSRLGTMFDEPFADASQIPTYLVSQLTRASVTVALSGDGGDEGFAGYNRYLMPDLLRRLRSMPLLLRELAARGLTQVTPSAWDRLARALPRRLRPPQAGEKLYKFADALRTDDLLVLYHLLVSQWPGGVAPVLGESEPDDAAQAFDVAPGVTDPVRRLQYLDLATYLPDDVLTKVDRASMAVALETRVPLLDHRVIEFGLGLPPHLRRLGGQSKGLLRRVLARYVPPELTDRPKSGFAVPIVDWLRGPLRDWAEPLLDEKRLGQRGLVDPAAVRSIWAEHLAGQANRQYALWTVLMFESWAQHWLDQPA